MWGCTIVDVVIVLFYLHLIYHSESSLSLSRNKPAPVYSSYMKTLKDYKVIMWSLCCMWSCDPCVYVIVWPLCLCNHVTPVSMWSCEPCVYVIMWALCLCDHVQIFHVRYQLEIIYIGKQNQIPHQVKPK